MADWEKYKHIVSHIAVGSGVVNTVADWVKQGNYRKILVVCDTNTQRVAGGRVIDSLKAAGLDVAVYCFPEDEPLPDEPSVGRLISAYTSDTDLILGVGSGTINDLCTYTGNKVGCPSAIVGTAPSMDGYASLGSAMLFGGVKVTPMTQCPVAIFCDTDILSAAPMHMIAAGLGDMLGKITSLADWQLSHILTGEPMPEDIVGIMESALIKVLEASPKASKRDPVAIESITEGLILSGIAMSLYGDSRPASGTEHHLAHFWEMRMLMTGHKPALHGIKVGLATVLGLEMWNLLSELGTAVAGNNDGKPQGVAKSRYASLGGAHSDKAKQDIRRLYGPAAEAILQVDNPDLPLEHIKEHSREILAIAKTLPKPNEIAAILSSVGLDMRPKGIGLSADTLYNSILYARERKKTYTLMQLLGNLNLLEDFALRANQYFAVGALKGVKCFVLDMDGTIYLDNNLFPFTQGFLKHLEDAGKDYVFFTNNSSQNAAHYTNKLLNMGIEVDADKLLMSTHVLLEHLKNIYPSNLPDVFVAGTAALRDDFTAAGFTVLAEQGPTDEKPDIAVLGFDRDMDYGRLAKLCDFVRAGVPFYGVNMDYNCPVEGGFIPDCGSLAAAVYASTGIMPEFFGKPSRRALDFIARKTGYREDELCFIGDRLYTDIAITDGTKARSVLVLSGETKIEEVQASPHIPDLVVEDLSKLKLN